MANSPLVTLHAPQSAAAEAYRTLRTNIEFSSVDSAIKTVLMTSATPLDDKASTVANLAVAMADGDRRVVLVDADLRRPMQHTIFGLSNDAGFSSMFRDDASFEQPPLQSVANTSLQVLTSGALPNIPSQLLASNKMEVVLNKLTSIAEMVIFDAPPIIAANDASLLASQVDGVLLVVKAGGDKREHIIAAKDRLEKVNANFIGAVLTNARVDTAVQQY